MIHDKKSFIILEIKTEIDTGERSSKFLCAGSKEKEQGVHTLLRKWTTAHDDGIFSLYMYYHDKTPFCTLHDDLQIEEIELNLNQSIDLCDIKSLEHLQHELFIQVVLKCELSNYEFVPVDINKWSMNND